MILSCQARGEQLRLCPLPDTVPPPQLWRVLHPLWSRRAALRGHFVGIASIGLMLVLIGGGYLVTLRLALARDVSLGDTRTVIDTYFGPTPWAVVVYMTLYLYFPITVALAPRDRSGWSTILLNLQAQLLLALGSFALFLVAPTYLHARSEMELQLQHAAPWALAVFDQLYLLDAPYNAWPSLHVSLSLLMVLTSQRLMRGRFPRMLCLAWWPAWLVLLWSILATKQHHAFDIWTGVLAGALTWYAYLAPRLKHLTADQKT